MKLKKILLSVATVGAVAGLGFYATNAFFSDTETSTGNVFQAGAIDLTIDNESYYNGEPSLDTSWELSDLTVERFFNFADLKPGDWGEDTVSIHVNNNDAYLCANINVTDNSDNGMTEPESQVDQDPKAGELAENLYFMFWVDDGDNVWEGGDDEPVIAEGLASQVLDGATFALADTSGQSLLAQVDGNKTYYIGKAWCYGTMTYPAAEQLDWVTPTDYTGFTCNGELVGNESQTDRLMADISFYAEQRRHNDSFLCKSVNWDTPTVSYRDLENKNGNWEVIVDDTYGTIAYSNHANTFYGVVQGQGLEPNSKYQITLNGPGTCTTTDDNLATFGANLFESGYWNNWAPNLSNTCVGAPGEGLYNMNLIGDWYTFESDASGSFVYPFNFDLPSGDYTGVKVLVKKMLDTHVSPWVDASTEHTTNLFETSPINFSVN